MKKKRKSSGAKVGFSSVLNTRNKAIWLRAESLREKFPESTLREIYFRIKDKRRQNVV